MTFDDDDKEYLALLLRPTIKDLSEVRVTVYGNGRPGLKSTVEAHEAQLESLRESGRRQLDFKSAIAAIIISVVLTAGATFAVNRLMEPKHSVETHQAP